MVVKPENSPSDDRLTINNLSSEALGVETLKKQALRKIFPAQLLILWHSRHRQMDLMR
jgi:hypothetical protein